MFSGNERFFVLDFWFVISLGSDFVETGFRARLLVACSPVSTNRNQGGYFLLSFLLGCFLLVTLLLQCFLSGVLIASLAC
jgi:hypothetical protein